MPKKGGLKHFVDLRGGGAFEGQVDTPMHTMIKIPKPKEFSENVNTNRRGHSSITLS